MRLSYWFMFVLLTAVAVLNAGLRFAPVPPRRDLAQFPSQIGDWRGSADVPLDAHVLDVLRVSDYINRDYTNGIDRLNLYVAYYKSQRAGETMHSPRNCLPGDGWEIIANDTRQLRVSEPARSFDINRYVIQKDNSQVLVYYWYDSHGRAFASEYKGKFYLIWDTLRTGRTDGALVRVMVPAGANTARSDAAAMSFSQLVYPALAGFLADYTSPTKPPASDLH